MVGVFKKSDWLVNSSNNSSNVLPCYSQYIDYSMNYVCT